MAAEIKVKVITMGGEEKEVAAPLDIRVDDFTKELITALNLPVNDAEGHPISWRIDNKDAGRTLEGTKTLEENGVQESQRLLLLRSTIAGGEQ